MYYLLIDWCELVMLCGRLDKVLMFLQIAGMANRTTLVDNNTWNNSHIALVGKAMSSNESAAYEVRATYARGRVARVFD